MRFYLGTHEVSWLERPDLATVPLFVSHKRLTRRVSLPVATGAWALDSGGFSEIAKHGEFTFTEAQYVAAVRRYRDEIGGMQWAAPMDWMCETPMLARTGLTVANHQRRTVDNYLTLRHLADDLPFVPVLQGHTLDDYQRCADLYEVAGVSLASLPLVGLGSVCRRQDTNEIGTIVGHFHAQGLHLHGFGCKAGAFTRYGQLLASADSLAWSYAGRRRGTCPLKSRCANHLHYALAWREQALRRVPGGYSRRAS